MNPISKLLTIFFAMNLAISIATADEPNIPASSWEQHPEGIALAITLDSQTEIGLQKGSIQIRIRNTSNTNKVFRGPAIDSGVQIFYIDADKQIPLHDYSDPSHGVILSAVPPPVIKPGETLLRTVNLTSNELILVKSHPVKCSFCIYDPTTKNSYKIESSPRTLTTGP